MSKIKTDVLVIGAGVGGLAAAAWLQEKGVGYIVMDSAPKVPMNMHNGVHYLHSIPKLPFEADIKEITLTDGILCADGMIDSKPTLNDCLEYSEKVREIQHPSSIMEVGKKNKVFLPSTNTMNSLIEEMHDFCQSMPFFFGRTLIKVLDHEAHFSNQDGEIIEVSYEHCISTVPLNVIKNYFPELELKDEELKSTPIHVTNYEVDRIVPNWLINLYVPSRETPIYRISVLNGKASVESTHELNEIGIHMNAPQMLKMFYLRSEMKNGKIIYNENHYTWQTGKVISISTDKRKEITENLKKKNWHQQGRFGLWDRKLLVDSTINQVYETVNSIV